MPAYVPPQMRGKVRESDASQGESDVQRRASEASEGFGDKGKGKSKDGGGYQQDTADGDGKGATQEGEWRNSERKGDNRREGHGGKGQQQKGGGRGRRFDEQMDETLLDWRKRQDGRRQGGEEKTELEVFGEKKVHSSAGIEFDKYDAIPVQRSGERAEEYKEIKRFSEGKLHESLFDNLRRCGYERPTPVQKWSIPIVVAGRDLMACAQTGSGKTCAFMVPCLESLLRSGPPPNPRQDRRPTPMPCALVLAPTRELVQQIHLESCKFAYDTGIRACLVYGGSEMGEQRNDLEKGCDVLIATPGRLSDMCQRKHISLVCVQFFILDEADRMLDMGFEPQVRQIVENFSMSSKSRNHRQSMMFSATFARDVQKMAVDFLHDYVFITVGRVGAAAETVTQEVMFAQTVPEKVVYLEKQLKRMAEREMVIIFVETKKSADSLELELHQKKFNVTAIHGDRSQQERNEALHAFKTGANPILVATDVAARGLDIPDVSLVVNFDMPKQIDDYVHRIGRTGRAGRKGTAVAFVNDRCSYLPELGELLRNAKQEPPQWFDNLCRSRPMGKGGARSREGGPSFGGQDTRVQDMQEGKLAPKAVATPQRAGAPAARESDWGNTGAEDAW